VSTLEIEIEIPHEKIVDDGKRRPMGDEEPLTTAA
jgi:hypothetical protein